MAFPDKYAGTADSLDTCQSERGLGRRLLREEDSSWWVWNAALNKMIQPENETSANLTLLLTGLPPQESSWAFAKHARWQFRTASNHHPTTSGPAARGPNCLTHFCLAKLRNTELPWSIIFKRYVLLETAHWLKHTLWTITLSGVRKVLKGSWRNQYLN